MHQPPVLHSVNEYQHKLSLKETRTQWKQPGDSCLLKYNFALLHPSGPKFFTPVHDVRTNRSSLSLNETFEEHGGYFCWLL